MKKKLAFVFALAILLTCVSGLLVQQKTENTLTNLGPLDDPICIQSVVANKGFPLAWQKGVTSCSEKDAHSDVGVFDAGSFSLISFVVDTVIYFVALSLLLKLIQHKKEAP